MIDDQRNLIFVENPKTATWSVKCAFLGNQHFLASGLRHASFNHDIPRVIAAKYPLEWKRYAKFVVVRNTFDRAHSFFHFYRGAADSASYQAMNFDQWVARGCPPPEESHLKAPMWGEGRCDDVLCQLRYCEGIDEIVVLHAFARQQRCRELKKGIERVCSFAGIPVPRIPVDGNHFGRTNQSVVWDRATVDRLSEMYRDEIERFDFKTPENLV